MRTHSRALDEMSRNISHWVYGKTLQEVYQILYNNVLLCVAYVDCHGNSTDERMGLQNSETTTEEKAGENLTWSSIQVHRIFKTLR